jgi:arylsulfatase
MEQRAHGLGVWKEPLVALRAPSMINLRSDPFERATADASVFYDKWMMDRAFLLVPAQAIVGEFLKTFREFPPRAKAASFSIDQAMEKLMPKDSGGVPPKEIDAPKKSKAEVAAAHN